MQKGGKMKRIWSVKVFILMLLLVGLIPMSVNAASMKVKYDGKSYTYSGKQVKVSLDGKSIGKKNTPGIIVNNTSLVSYIDIFKNGLGATCSYTAKTGVVQIRKNGHTVKMYLGSRTAYVNGVKKQITAAPKKVYYYSCKTTKVLVPARFVAESLGYTYTWSGSTGTAKIKSPYSIYYESSWKVYPGTKGKVTFNEDDISLPALPALILNNTVMIPAQTVFEDSSLDTTYSYTKKNKKLVLGAENTTITYVLGSKKAFVNGEEFQVTEAPKLVKDNVSNQEMIIVPAKFTIEKLGYVYNWNKDVKTCEIKTSDYESDTDTSVQSEVLWKWTSDKKKIENGAKYSNLLLECSLVKTPGKETLVFEGLDTLAPSLKDSEDTSEIKLEFTNLHNEFDKFSQLLVLSSCVQKISFSKCADGVVLSTINVVKDKEYYISSSGTKYEIHFLTEDESGSEEEEINYAVHMKLPDNISLADIKTEDMYESHKFTVTLPDDYVSYVKKHVNVSTNSTVSNYTCEMDESRDTRITFYTEKLQGYKLSESEGVLYIQVDDPRKVYKNIVVLDAGHGGTDPGCNGNGLIEKNMTFNIIYKYIKDYFESPDSPVKAYWTRKTDTKISLQERPTYSKKYGADIFISFHMNSAPGTNATGTETYYCVSNNSTNSNGVSSKKLATFIQERFPTKMGLSGKRGVKTANHVVTKNNTVPAVLVEYGFLSNKADAAIIENTSGQKKAAKAMYDIICEFFEKYPSER